MYFPDPDMDPLTITSLTDVTPRNAKQEKYFIVILEFKILQLCNNKWFELD